tara:strand:+ start:46 stop:432 length:387 start_codon:yes stop_codon:yes gene_type:complete
MINQNLINLILISFGAVLGANLRFLIVTKISLFGENKAIKVLLANLISSFILGLSIPIMSSNNLSYNQNLTFLFLIGFIGSLSTFSTFINDLYELTIKKNFKNSTILIFLSIFLGLIFLYMGYLLSSA